MDMLNILQNCSRSETFAHQIVYQVLVQYLQKSEENPQKTQYVNTPRKFKSLSFVVMVERSQYSWTYSCQNDSCRMKYSGILQYPKMFWENVKNICYKCFIYTRIFGAYGPIMFALQVWEGFRASWRGGPLCENCSFNSNLIHVRKDTWHLRLVKRNPQIYVLGYQIGSWEVS